MEEKHCPGLAWGDLEDLIVDNEELLQLFNEYHEGRMPNYLSFKVRGETKKEKEQLISVGE
jgi:hypothetical protein